MQIRRHHFLCARMFYEPQNNNLFMQQHNTFTLRQMDCNHGLKPFYVFKVVCTYLSFSHSVPDHQLLHGVSQATQVYYNYTGSSPCVNTSQTATGSLGFLGWFYQVCSDGSLLHLFHQNANVRPLVCRPVRRW